MSFDFITYPNEPIVTIQFTGKSENAVEETRAIRKHVMAFIKENPEIKTLYMITDIRDQKLNFGDLVQGMAEGMSRDSSKEYASLGITQVGILVGNGQLLNLIMRFSGQDQYGRQKFIAFNDLDEALAYARADHQGLLTKGSQSA